MSPSKFSTALREFDSTPEAAACTAWLAGNGDAVVELSGAGQRHIRVGHYDSASDLAAAMVDAAVELRQDQEAEQARAECADDAEREAMAQGRARLAAAERESTMASGTWTGFDDDDDATGGWW